MWIHLQNWNHENMMRLKLSKCSCVTLGERCLLLESQGLSLQLNHKHLGMFLTARGFDWLSQVEYTARKAKRTLALLRRVCYTWKTPVKIQLIKTLVLPIIQHAAPLMVTASSRLLANPSINECLKHAQKLRKASLASQWSLLDDRSSIHSWKQGISVVGNGSHSNRTGSDKGS